MALWPFDLRSRVRDAPYGARGGVLGCPVTARLRSWRRSLSEESPVVTHPFLDLAPLSAARFAAIEDRVARLLGTRQDVVIMQGEALLPLEGRSAGRPGRARPR